MNRRLDEKGHNYSLNKYSKLHCLRFACCIWYSNIGIVNVIFLFNLNNDLYIVVSFEGGTFLYKVLEKMFLLPGISTFFINHIIVMSLILQLHKLCVFVMGYQTMEFSGMF